MKFLSIISLLICLFKFSAGQITNSNAIFKASKGTWKCPVKSGYIIDRNSIDDLQPTTGINISCDSFSYVQAVFDGTVVLVNEYDSVFMIIVKYGDYFIGYSNLFESCVKKGDTINTGDIIAYTAKDLDDIYCVEILLGKNRVDIDPADWFKDNIPVRSRRY